MFSARKVLSNLEQLVMDVLWERGEATAEDIRQALANRHYMKESTARTILRRLEDFSGEPLRSALKTHEKYATLVLDLEDKVAALVKKLKERGLVSPYLRSFVVARINPMRWIKGDLPSFADVFKTMQERAAKFNVDKVRPQDLAGAAGPPDEQI